MTLTEIPIAIRYILLSALGFAMMSTCVKTVASYGIPVFEIIAARAAVSLFLSYLDVKRKRISIWGYNRPLLIARGTVGAIALVCIYYAVTTLPLADATVLQYTHPAFTAILALILWVNPSNALPSSASSYTLVRRLSQTEDSSVLIFYFPLIALPISLV